MEAARCLHPRLVPAQHRLCALCLLALLLSLRLGLPRLCRRLLSPLLRQECIRRRLGRRLRRLPSRFHRPRRALVTVKGQQLLHLYWIAAKDHFRCLWFGARLQQQAHHTLMAVMDGRFQRIHPTLFSFVSTAAPASNSTRTAPSCPCALAYSNAAFPFLCFKSTAAPASNSARATATCPMLQATNTNSGV